MEKNYITIEDKKYLYLDTIYYNDINYGVFASEIDLKKRKMKLLILECTGNIINLLEEFSHVFDHEIVNIVAKMFKTKWKYILESKKIYLEFENVGLIKFEVTDILKIKNINIILLQYVDSEKQIENGFFENDVNKFTILGFEGDLDDEDISFISTQDEKFAFYILDFFQKKWKHVYDFKKCEIFLLTSEGIRWLE